MNKKYVVEEIKNIILDRSLAIQTVIIDEDMALYEDCGLDSLGIIDLIVSIEERFSIEFSEEDMSYDNLGSISLLADIVLNRRG